MSIKDYMEKKESGFTRAEAIDILSRIGPLRDSLDILEARAKEALSRYPELRLVK